ncbi:MAG: NADPH:quinone oxidoreductase family protein [Alphaproteobacteria bacterium]|nr:NADPH:quinone oxidoreductase family protein [Alphaproteobacteria bacterium]
MRAMMVRENSMEMSAMRLEEVELPPPGAKEVRVRIRAASTQFPDILMIQKKYQHQPPLPYIPGTEFAGDVSALGEGVTQWKIGDAVVGGVLNGGGFAEEVNIHEGALRPKPGPLSYGQACSFRSAYLTAQVSLIRRGELQAGETLLVHGAAGGVGLAAVEVGKMLGATVIGAGSSDSKLEIVKKYGADHVINYGADFKRGFREKVKELTGGNGADVIYDPVGGDVFDESIRCINWGGRLLVVGFASGRIPSAPVNMPLIKGFSIVGVRAGEYGRKDPQKGRENIALVDKWAEDGVIRPYVCAEVPLERAHEALAMIQDRTVVGRVVVVM